MQLSFSSTSLCFRLVHFCFWLRCLIYKVHAAFSQTALIDYHIFLSLSRTFFKFFQSFSMPFYFLFRVVFADNSDRIPHLFFFVNTFFRVFSKFLDVSLSFFAFQRSSLADNFDRIPHRLLFVNTFLQIFSKSFCNVVPYSFPSQRLKSPKVLI